jgi:hypothetical protein
MTLAEAPVIDDETGDSKGEFKGDEKLGFLKERARPQIQQAGLEADIHGRRSKQEQ